MSDLNLPGTPDATLIGECARKANDAHQRVAYHRKGMVLEAIEAGENLLRAHALLKEQREPWMKWVKENCIFSHSSANLYMRIARHAQVVTNAQEKVADFTLNEADKFLKLEYDKRTERRVMTIAQVEEVIDRAIKETLDALKVARERLGNEKWGEWLNSHYHIGPETAEAWMKAAESQTVVIVPAKDRAKATPLSILPAPEPIEGWDDDPFRKPKLVTPRARWTSPRPTPETPKLLGPFLPTAKQESEVASMEAPSRENEIRNDCESTQSDGTAPTDEERQEDIALSETISQQSAGKPMYVLGDALAEADIEELENAARENAGVDIADNGSDEPQAQADAGGDGHHGEPPIVEADGSGDDARGEGDIADGDIADAGDDHADIGG